MSTRIKELRAQRENMGRFKSKKVIDSEIKRLKNAHKQAENYFTRTYDISPEQASEKVRQMEYIATSKQHYQEKLQEKLTALAEEKETFALEYKKQKLLAEIRPDRQKIHDKLAQLDNETAQSRHFAHSERTINIVTQRHFEQILTEVTPIQAQKLVDIRANEAVREQSRGFAREY